jgi:hypothetical protein
MRRGFRSIQKVKEESGPTEDKVGIPVETSGVRKEYRSHRRLGEASGESAGDKRIRGQQDS